MVGGRATMGVGSEEADLGPGDAVIVPPRAEHWMRNSGPGEVEYVVVGITTDAGGKTVITER